TGVAVYDSYGSGGSNWFVFGGTSVASPIVASVGARAGGTSPAAPYANRGALNDVVGGSNGSCSPAYLCTAVTGYDGPTGLGSPNGTGAFGGPVTPPPTTTTTSSTTSTTAPTTTTLPSTTTTTSAGGQLVLNPGFETGGSSPW